MKTTTSESRWRSWDMQRSWSRNLMQKHGPVNGIVVDYGDAVVFEPRAIVTLYLVMASA